MTTRKQGTTQDDINAMSDMSGEAELKSAPKYVLPSIRLQGKDGVFNRTIIENDRLKVGDDGKALLEDVGKEVLGVVLKVRKTYVDNSPDTQLFSNEVGNGANVQVSVFSKLENAKGGFTIGLAHQGTPAEIKARFPEISMVQIIYFMICETNEIVRLKVKGMGLPELFAYWKTFENDEHVFEYITKLGVKSDKNKFGSFFVNTFERGEKVKNLRDVKTAMSEVYEKITEIEDYFIEQNKNRSGEGMPIEEAPAPQNDTEMLLKPVKDTSTPQTGQGVDDEEIAKPNDEIDVKEIPFGDKKDGDPSDPSDKDLKEAGL